MLKKINQLSAYEQGELTMEETIRLFSELIYTGAAWSLQGSYGRAAMYFIDNGWIETNGDINWHKLEEVV